MTAPIRNESWNDDPERREAPPVNRPGDVRYQYYSGGAWHSVKLWLEAVEGSREARGGESTEAALYRLEQERDNYGAWINDLAASYVTMRDTKDAALGRMQQAFAASQADLTRVEAELVSARTELKQLRAQLERAS